MRTVRRLLALLTFLVVSPAPSTAQTVEEIGAWQYVDGLGSEAIYTESTDADRTFSLEVGCEDGKPNVELTFLVATQADDIGLDPDRFPPDGQVVTRLDGNEVAPGDWSFSTYSETFVNERPDPFLATLKEAEGMDLEVQDAEGVHVGTYSSNLRGAASALDALSCYPKGG